MKTSVAIGMGGPATSTVDAIGVIATTIAAIENPTMTGGMVASMTVTGTGEKKSPVATAGESGTMTAATTMTTRAGAMATTKEMAGGAEESTAAGATGITIDVTGMSADHLTRTIGCNGSLFHPRCRNPRRQTARAEQYSRHCTLMLEALMIGHHLSTSAL